MSEKGFKKSSGQSEIDLMGLFVYMLKHWRQGIVFALVGILLGSLGGIFLKQKEWEPTTEEEKLRVESLLSEYETCQKNAEKRNIEYVAGLDPKGEYYNGKLQYHITANNFGDIQVLGDLLNITSTDAYIDTMRVVLGLSETEPDTYVNTVFTQNFSSFQTENNLIMSADVDYSVGYGLLTYNFYYLTADQLSEMKNVVEQMMDELIDEHSKGYAGCKVSVLVDTENKLKEEDIEDAASTIEQQNRDALLEFYAKLDSLVGTKTNVNTDYSNIVSYFKATYMEEQPEKSNFNKKYLIIGILLAFVCWVAKYMIQYLKEGILYQDNVVSEQYGISVLGIVNVEKNHKGIDKALDNMAGEKKKCYCTAKYLATSLEELEMDSLVISGIGTSKAFDSLMKEIKDSTSQKIIFGDLCTNSELLKDACRQKTLVLLMSLGQTREADINSTLEICEAHNLEVKGAILVNEGM